MQGFVRWPPHANLLYPFLEDSGSTFEAAAVTAASALQDVKPVQVGVAGIARELQRAAFFAHAVRTIHTKDLPLIGLRGIAR